MCSATRQCSIQGSIPAVDMVAPVITLLPLTAQRFIDRVNSLHGVITRLVLGEVYREP
ncbi:hypothetical protein HaLaN_27683, partial [Haematococcus lacustris]